MTFPLLSILAQGQQGGHPAQGLIMMGLILVIFWVLIIRPQQKQRKELAAKVASMKVGDKVVTLGGVHGKIHKLRDTTALIKAAEGVIIEFEKSSIGQVIPKGSKKAAEKQAEDDPQEETEEK